MLSPNLKDFDKSRIYVSPTHICNGHFIMTWEFFDKNFGKRLSSLRKLRNKFGLYQTFHVANRLEHMRNSWPREMDTLLKPLTKSHRSLNLAPIDIIRNGFNIEAYVFETDTIEGEDNIKVGISTDYVTFFTQSLEEVKGYVKSPTEMLTFLDKSNTPVLGIMPYWAPCLTE